MVRPITKAAITLAAAVTTAAALAGVAAGPASAKTYPPPRLTLLCTAAANNGTPEGSVCALPSGQTTAPNNYSATIAVSKTGAAATITFAVTAGSLPPGLTMPASSPSGSSPVITGNPTHAGTFNFTIKATGGGLTATHAYQITITVQGPPDQLLCDPADNGGFLENGVCVLPDAIAGVPYQGHLLTSHQVGGTLSVVSGALPPGLTLPATFTGAGDIIGGTPTQQAADNFTVQGTGDQGQPLYQVYSIVVDPNQPLAINASGGTHLVGMVGGAFASDFFVSGGAAPYTWSVASGQLPPGLSLQTTAGPRDANNELAGTPTTAGTYTFTMKLTDYDGQQATQTFTATIDPPLQITSTTLPAGTVGKPYSHDLTAQGGDPPYSFFIFQNDPLPPGLSFGSVAPDTDNVLTGTPTQAGTFSFTLQVQDSDDDTATATVTITINP